jgi:hypothetical protein
VDTTPHRTFTFDEARALLPSVREKTQRALAALDGLAAASDEDAGAARARMESAVESILNGWRAEVEALGIEVKGPWLVDFDSGAGYYCWKWPEASLEFFHGYEEGFAGRVPLQ